MLAVPSTFKVYLRRLAFFMVLMLMLRLFFIVYNFNQLPDSGILPWLSVFWGGLLFDWIFVWYGFIPIYLISGFEDRWKPLQWIGKGYALLLSFLVIVLSFIDTLFFPFSKVRTGAELLSMGGENNISIWVYLIDYGWAVALILLLTFLVWKYYPALKESNSIRRGYIYFLCFIPVGIFVARGGLRLKPLHYTDAILFSPQGPWQASLNSGLVFAQSYLGDDGELFHGMIPNAGIDEKDRQRFPASPSKPNICILVLESFGKEYIGYNAVGRPSYTPFLDSLSKHSLYFNYFYANGLKSMDAVPAIFASIPALFNKPFIISSAAGKKFVGLAACLKKTGYQSAFFHGADEGSMGFKPFLLRSGFDSYYSKDSYEGSPQDYDGQWGIYDEPFLQFAIQKMDQIQEPFMTGIFTLSSHHPFSIPQKYQGNFHSGTLPIHKSIQYTDFALKQFFMEASRHTWFSNTIFIITADHTAMNETPRYQSAAGRYEVPLLIYAPGGNWVGLSNKTGQHIDILPTVLQMTGYPNPFISAGRSLLDTANAGQAFQYFQGNYGYIRDNKFIMSQGQNISAYYSLNTDPELKENLLPSASEDANEMFKSFKTTVGSFQQRVIRNQLGE